MSMNCTSSAASRTEFGHGLLDLDPGDLLDQVLHRLEVLDVHGADHVDAGVADLLDVLPPFAVAEAGRIGVRQLVDESHVRMTRDDAVDVHVGERRALVRHRDPRDDLEGANRLGGAPAPVRLDESHDDVLAILAPLATLAQHGERLPRPRSGAEVYLEQPAASRQRRAGQLDR